MPIVPDLSGVGPGAVPSPHDQQSSEFAGWTANLAAVFLDEQTLVLQIIGWIGGGPSDPPIAGQYISENGLTFEEQDATNFLISGVAGPAGSRILYGTGAPSSAVGNNGDTYINTSIYSIYGPKVSDAWPTGVSLIGPAGAGTGDMLKSENLSGLINYATARTNLGLVIGTNVQAYNAVLTALAGASANGQSLITAANYAAMKTLLAYAIADISGLQTALDAKEAYGEYNAINAQSDTTYTLVLSDKGKIIECTNASPITLTIPPNSSVAFPVKSRIDLVQYGDGQLTIEPGAGVTLRSAGNKFKFNGQYACASLYKHATNTWVLLGNLTT